MLPRPQLCETYQRFISGDLTLKITNLHLERVCPHHEATLDVGDWLAAQIRRAGVPDPAPGLFPLPWWQSSPQLDSVIDHGKAADELKTVNGIRPMEKGTEWKLEIGVRFTHKRERV